MVDDKRLLLSPCFDDVVITEVKTNQPCTLNGPWTKPDREIVHRVLAAIGCLRHEEIGDAATRIYTDGVAIIGHTRVRLVAIGRDRDPGLRERYREVLQLTWQDIIGFIWDRFERYRLQKGNVEQWDPCGRHLRRLARSYDQHTFLKTVCQAMGLQQPPFP